MTVDHVVLRDRDTDAVPPDKVLAVSVIGPSSRGEMPLVVLEACSYDEDTDSSTRTRLGSFSVDIDVLVDALNTAAGEVLVLLDQTGVEAVSP